MAVTLANDYNNESLSSYVKWLDITRPGSNHNFEYLVNFFSNINTGQKKTILEKIESSITKDTNTQRVLTWFKKNIPVTAKGNR